MEDITVHNIGSMACLLYHTDFVYGALLFIVKAPQAIQKIMLIIWLHIDGVMTSDL